MFFKQIVVEGMGCLSYFIGCSAARVACVVDPKRDVEDYLHVSRKYGMKITHIFETHVHADHVSGNLELRSRTGAEICYLEGTPARFDFKAVKEGDVFEFGTARLEILSTPGHTPHSMSILVSDRSRSDDPWLILTGDCLFVGDVGRPDLAGRELLLEQVNNLYASLYEKLRKLPSSLEVFPAHGEGSLCGRGLSSKTSSTIGFEARNNPLLGLSREEFIKQMTSGFPERPKSFTHIIETNLSGPPLLERCPVVRDLSADDVKREIERGATIIDTRDAPAFGGVHIPGSINIGFAPQSANWVGMVVDPDAELVLVVADEPDYHAMCAQLHRIGYDRIIGYLFGGIAAWQEEGYPIAHLRQVSAEKLMEKLSTGRYKHLYDVRTLAEWESGHIEQAEHLPLTGLLESPPDVHKDDEIIVTCAVGYRGNIAASFLQGRGYRHVHSLAGGMKAWLNAGFPVVR